MSRPPALYYLVGPPSVGKLTVARALMSRLERAVVVDNHLWSDPIFVPGGLTLGGPIAPLNPLRERVRRIVMEAVEIAPRDVSHVVTHYLDDDPECQEIVDEMRALAGRRGVDFVPVWLTASRADILARVGNEDRSAKAKLTDATILAEILDVPVLPPPPDALHLDTSRLSPAEAADAIVAAR